MAEETKTTEKETNELMRCPCCGEMTLHRPLEIKSAVLDEYMASIISGVQFQHTYTLYGSVDITVTILSKQEGRKLYTTLQMLDKIIKDSNTPDALKQKMDELYGTIQLYSAITSIRTRKDGMVQKRFAPSETIMETCDSLLALGNEWAVTNLEDIYADCCAEGKLSTMPDVMLRAVVKTHNDLYNVLLETGFDENFWKGIELA